MSELKPCRHCGGEVAIALHGNEFDEYWWTVQRGHDDETACKCRLFMESDRKFTLEDGEKPEDSPLAMEQRAKLIEKWNRSSPAPYEFRIAGYGRDCAEIMCDAFGDLMSCAGETCTTNQLDKLRRHIEEWIGGIRFEHELATPGSGKLTAEQVRTAVMSADRWEKPMGNTGLTNTHLIIRDDGWQAIADELNAIGGEECEIETTESWIPAERYHRCKHCSAFFAVLDASVDIPPCVCPNCGRTVKR